METEKVRKRGRSLGILVQRDRENGLRGSEFEKTRASVHQQQLWFARDKAIAAFENGQPRSSCPYEKRFDLRRIWLSVWDELYVKKMIVFGAFVYDSVVRVSRAGGQDQANTLNIHRRNLKRLQGLKDC